MKKPAVIKTIQIPGYLTLGEAAERMGVSYDYVKLLIYTGYFPAARLRSSRLRLVEEDKVDLYIVTHPRLGLNRKKK